MPSLSNHRQFLHWNRSEIVSNSSLGIHFRKPRTAAGFVPKVCKTQARKTLSSNSSKIRAQGMHTTSQKNSFMLPLESKKNSFGPQEHMPSLRNPCVKSSKHTSAKLSPKSGLRTPLPKASNSKTLSAVAFRCTKSQTTIWTRAENGQNPSQKTFTAAGFTASEKPWTAKHKR